VQQCCRKFERGIDEFIKAVMRKLEALVIEFPEVYRCIKKIEYDKTYEMLKSCVTYRKPKWLTEEHREQQREQIKIVTEKKKFSDYCRKKKQNLV
jgi:hypothetical protein